MNHLQRQSELPAAVRAAPAFEGLSEASIIKILAKGRFRDYQTKSWLYRQGDAARHFFLLESGLVSLSEVTPGGDKTIIRFVVPGEVTGFVAVSNLTEHVMSAEVLNPTRVIAWERETSMSLLWEVPGAAANLLSIMVTDVVSYYHHIRRLKADPVDRRIRWAILELFRALGRTSNGRRIIDHASYQRLAELAGTNIYSVSRELNRLQRRGILDKEKKRLVLLRPKELGLGLALHGGGALRHSSSNS